jgi:hypothetical protein
MLRSFGVPGITAVSPDGAFVVAEPFGGPYATLVAQNGWSPDPVDDDPYGSVSPAMPNVPPGYTSVRVPARYERKCETFGVAGARVRVVVGSIEVSQESGADGRFAISTGGDLAQLQASGDSGIVYASLRNRSAQASLRLGGLNEIAAYRLLDEMREPSTDQVIAFVRQWRGTDAAALAVDRFGQQACGEFRHDWSEMLSSGDIQRIGAVQARYAGEWASVFEEACPAEIRLLPLLEDLSAEVGVLGKP